MIRIAYLIDHLRVGGAQRHLLEVVRGLDRDRYSLEVWTAVSDPGDLGAVFEREDVPVRTFGIDGTMLSARTLVAAKRVARDLNRRRIHVAHGYLFEGNVLAALVGTLGRIPVTLVSKRSLDRYPRLDRRLAAWLSNCFANRVLVNAVAVRDFVAEHEWCPRQRMLVVPNGVALPRAASISAEPAPGAERVGAPLVGMVGRLSWKKGYEFALGAAAILRDRLPDIRFEIVGDGPLRAQLEDAARTAALTDTVYFLGQRRDAVELMVRFDCFVLSSIIEGMPNALLEAMALGRPVVTTAAGGSAEVVVDGESGLVVPPGDSLALAAAIERVLTEPGLAARLGAAATRRVREHFGLEAMLSALDSVYRQELARAGIPLSHLAAEAPPPRRELGRTSLG